MYIQLTPRGFCLKTSVALRALEPVICVGRNRVGVSLEFAKFRCMDLLKMIQLGLKIFASLAEHLQIIGQKNEAR
jgi:hypothetical protein